MSPAGRTGSERSALRLHGERIVHEILGEPSVNDVVGNGSRIGPDAFQCFLGLVT